MAEAIDTSEVGATKQATRGAVAEKFDDLSAAIIQTIDRDPGDQVTCRHINGDHYRCNWWGRQNIAGYDNPGMAGLLVTTFRVRKSAFLTVRRTASGLQIDHPALRPR